MGSEPLRNGPLLQARLASQLALRVMCQALQVKDYRQAGLVPGGDLRVKFSDPAYGLA